MERSIAVQKVASRRRTLPRGGERCIAAENLPSAWRRLNRHGEGCNAAGEFASRQRRLRCAREGSIATEKFASRQRTFHCHRGVCIALDKLTSPPRSPKGRCRTTPWPAPSALFDPHSKPPLFVVREGSGGATRGITDPFEGICRFDVEITVVATELLIGLPEGAAFPGKSLVLIEREEDGYRHPSPGELHCSALFGLSDDTREPFSGLCDRILPEHVVILQDINMYIIGESDAVCHILFRRAERCPTPAPARRGPT